MWMRCVLVLTVCQQTLCIEQPFRHVAENTTCLDIKVESRLACTGNDQFYHCLLDENYTKEFEVCRDWKWIPGGKCAYFNSYGRGNVDERNCEGNSTLQCAPGQFRSYMNTKYKACYVKKRIPTTTPISTVTIRPTSSGGSVPPNITGEAPPGSVPPESQFDGSALSIAFGVIVPLILLVVVGILLFKRRSHPGGTSKEEPSVKRGEDEVLLSTGTKYQEENEQNDRQQKRTSKEESPVEGGEGDTLPSTQENEQNVKQQKDERTITEDTESSPLLAGNTNENQSEEESVKNGDTSEVNKLDSSQSQKNDPFQTPPTSPTTAQDILTNDVVAAEKKEEEVLESKRTPSSPGEVSTSGTEDNLQLSSVDDTEKQNMVGSNEGNQSDREGNKKDTSKETERKGAVGIFVKSLKSIEKEDDEEGGGSSELQELLEHMCTGAARRILFNVAKINVDNLESYFQDESKKASVRKLLPPEYHSALKHESESRNSIPVIYAILQSSLSAEHQPKSGWGQEVKDTDTGVGDDVERVYKVHMLSREIHNPEEISVDGYVRLFEMLIGAVERLDIKGKCSEDYKEIVRRWENIQRKQWVKDKWNTFTNFITKWKQEIQS